MTPILADFSFGNMVENIGLIAGSLALGVVIGLGLPSIWNAIKNLRK